MSNCLYVKPFFQKTSKFFGVKEGLPDERVTCAVLDSTGKCWVGTENGLCVFDGKLFCTVTVGKHRKISALYTDGGGRLWVLAGKELYAVTGKRAKLFFTCGETLCNMAEDGIGDLWLLSEEYVYLYKEDTFVRFKNVENGTGRCIASFGDRRMFVSTENCILSLFGKRPRFGEITPESSEMPSGTVNALAADEWGHLWVGTQDGVSIYDMHSKWVDSTSVASLKKGNITQIILNKSGTKYIGTTAGMYIDTAVSSGFYSAMRWLPDFGVTAIAPAKDDSFVWVGTNKGVSLIKSQKMTLLEKAEHYQELTEKYIVREGYVTQSALSESGNIESATPSITDNDGLWTGVYVATQSYRYAVTGEKEAKLLARRSLKALFKLHDITGIPGFPARAYRRENEPGYGDGDIEWHPVTDEKGKLEWKGETSSDEIVGHFYGLTVYYDLCADGAEKKEICKKLCAVADHIISNGYELCDEDGKPTTWAHWGPDSLNRNDMWYCERGINSLELLMILKVCYSMSQNKRYIDEYRRLISTEYYALNTMQHKIEDCHVCHIDDNLGFLTVQLLLSREENKELRYYYLAGLKHHWQTQRVERYALWNIIYGSITGEPCDIENAVCSLERLPFTLIRDKMTNSLRSDLVWGSGQERFGGGRQLAEPLSEEERPLENNDGNPFFADGGSSMSAFAGTLYLHPYWMGRYYKLFNDDIGE